MCDSKSLSSRQKRVMPRSYEVVLKGKRNTPKQEGFDKDIRELWSKTSEVTSVARQPPKSHRASPVGHIVA